MKCVGKTQKEKKKKKQTDKQCIHVGNDSCIETVDVPPPSPVPEQFLRYEQGSISPTVLPVISRQ